MKLRNYEWNDDIHQLVANIPTFQSCKGQLYNQRQKLHPALPTTAADIDLNGAWTETTTREPFLLADDNTYGRILVFGTQPTLTHLAAADTVFAGGTFYTCPTLFHQLYTLHAMVDGIMYPLIYSLLPGKDQHIYPPTTHYATKVCQQRNIPFRSTTTVLDYEVAIRNAAYTVFPDINIKGCFFPLYSMYLVKRIEAWLTDSYKENDDIHLLVRKAAVLPLLPLNTIEDYWFSALEDIDDADTNIATLGYTDYVTSYWVEDNRNLWNHYAIEGPRTTNHLEGCHGKLKQLVKAPHPNIYSIIQLLKHEDAINAYKLIQYQAEENV